MPPDLGRWDQVSWLEWRARRLGFPRPTLIVSDGEECTAYWQTVRPVPSCAAPRLAAVEKRLAHEIRRLGCSAVLLAHGEPLPAVTGDQVQWPTPGAPLLPVSFEQLALAVLPMSRTEYRPPTPEELMARLIWPQRLGDMYMLAHSRSPLTAEELEPYLFPLAVGLSWLLPPDRAAETLEGIALDLCHSITRSRVQALTASVIQAQDRYRLTNAFLVDWLRISPKEQVDMHSIMSPEEAHRRKMDRDRKYSDRASYLADAEYRTNMAVDLKGAGLTSRQIAEVLTEELGEDVSAAAVRGILLRDRAK